MENGCDGKSAITQAFNDSVNPQDTDYDLISAVQNMLQQSKHSHLLYIRGHQDKTKFKLSQWAKLNIIADKMAKSINKRFCHNRTWDQQVEGEY